MLHTKSFYRKKAIRILSKEFGSANVTDDAIFNKMDELGEADFVKAILEGK